MRSLARIVAMAIAALGLSLVGATAAQAEVVSPPPGCEQLLLDTGGFGQGTKTVSWADRTELQYSLYSTGIRWDAKCYDATRLSVGERDSASSGYRAVGSEEFTEQGRAWAFDRPLVVDTTVIVSVQGRLPSGDWTYISTVYGPVNFVIPPPTSTSSPDAAPPVASAVPSAPPPVASAVPSAPPPSATPTPTPAASRLVSPSPTEATPISNGPNTRAVSSVSTGPSVPVLITLIVAVLFAATSAATLLLRTRARNTEDPPG